MNLNIFQKGFNYSQDGRGNRLVYHLQGCNMACAWCANPEGMDRNGTLMTNRDWLVETLCPKGAVSGGTLNRQQCGACTERLCLTPKYRSKGIRCSCNTIPVEAVFEEIKSSRPMFYDGGGVTFTGGEASMQFAALKELLILLKKEQIHTALETNGSHPELSDLFPYIGQLIMDLKHWEEEAHRKYTGISLEQVLVNLRKASFQHPHVDIRTPIIGKVNDSEEDFRQFIMLYRQLSGPNVTFELLKYHELGRNKWEECGRSYTMTEEAHVSWERVRYFQNMLIDNRLTYKQS